LLDIVLAQFLLHVLTDCLQGITDASEFSHVTILLYLLDVGSEGLDILRDDCLVPGLNVCSEFLEESLRLLGVLDAIRRCGLGYALFDLVENGSALQSAGVADASLHFAVVLGGFVEETLEVIEEFDKFSAIFESGAGAAWTSERERWNCAGAFTDSIKVALGGLLQLVALIIASEAEWLLVFGGGSGEESQSEDH